MDQKLNLLDFDWLLKLQNNLLRVYTKPLTHPSPNLSGVSPWSRKLSHKVVGVLRTAANYSEVKNVSFLLLSLITSFGLVCLCTVRFSLIVFLIKIFAKTLLVGLLMVCLMTLSCFDRVVI